MEDGQFFLLTKRRFLPLFITQFLGAFNDNAFKLAMLTLISYHLTGSQVESEYYQSLAAGLFILPFFLFSAIAGQLADKWDKAKIAFTVKCCELLLMLIGAVGFYQKNIGLLMITLFGMGMQSAFFGPVKYALLPKHLRREELLAGNGLIEASTFLAILLGTVLGTLSVSSQGQVGSAIILLLICAAIGLLASRFIPEARSNNQELKFNYNVFDSTWQLLKLSATQKKVGLIIASISWFWYVGALIMTKLPDFVHFQLRADSRVLSLFLALFSLGIGMGSLGVNRLLNGRANALFAPIGLLGMSFFSSDIFFASSYAQAPSGLWTLKQFIYSWSHWRIMFDLLLLSLCGGVYIVPLYTMLQIYSDESLRSRMIAANNVVNALYMILAAAMAGILAYLAISIRWIFMILAVLNLISVGVVVPLLPANSWGLLCRRFSKRSNDEKN